jgi:hypothetical protein
MPEIRRCPFCGGRKTIIELFDNGNMACCEDCGGLYRYYADQNGGNSGMEYAGIFERGSPTDSGQNLFIMSEMRDAYSGRNKTDMEPAIFEQIVSMLLAREATP